MYSPVAATLWKSEAITWVVTPLALSAHNGIIRAINRSQQSVDRDEYRHAKVQERGGHRLRASLTGQAGKPPGSGSLKSPRREYGAPGRPVIAARVRQRMIVA